MEESRSTSEGVCYCEGKTTATEEEVKKATTGFIIPLIAGILTLMSAAIFVFLAGFTEELGASIPIFLTSIFTSLAAVGVVFAVQVIIGAITIHMLGKQTSGRILVILFSIPSIAIGGSFLIGSI